MRELKNVIRMGRTAGLTPAHYAISDVPAGIFDADVFAHFSLSLCLSVCLCLDSMGWRMWCRSCCCRCSCTTGQSRPGVARFEKKSNKKNP